MGIIKEKIEIARQIIDDEKVQLAGLDLRYTKRMIQREMEVGKCETIEGAIEAINKKYRDIMFNNFGVGIRNGKLQKTPDVNRSDYFCFVTSQYLRRHPSEILERMDRSDKTELLTRKTSRSYTYDMNKNIDELLQNAFSFYFSQTSERERTQFIEGKLSIKERVALQKNILNILEQFQKILDKNILDAYARRVAQMATILDENGCLDKGVEIHNRRLTMMGLRELQVCNNAKGGNKPQVRNMSDWKNLGIVNKLPMDTLIAASAFFTNRLCKEYISYKRAIFILKELGMMDTLLLTEEVDIDSDVLKEALAKYQFLQSEARDTHAATVKKLPKEDTKARCSNRNGCSYGI